MKEVSLGMVEMMLTAKRNNSVPVLSGTDIFKQCATDTDTMSPKAQRRYSVEELRLIVAPIAEKYGVEKVYLFGSVARGDFNENSDYDFYIESDNIRSILIISEFFQDLRDAVGREIDLISTRSIDPEFLNKILTEGVVVYGQ